MKHPHPVPGIGRRQLWLLTLCVFAAVAQDAPLSQYIDKGACPFECCTYRDWTALEPITLYDVPNGKTAVGALKKGEVVKALTGEVHSIPVRVTATHDIAETDIKKGDAFYVLHYEGECYWTLWFKGKVAHAESCSDDAPSPRTTWWVKVQTRSGVTGWAVSRDHNFANQDACGSP